MQKTENTTEIVDLRFHIVRICAPLVKESSELTSKVTSWVMEITSWGVESEEGHPATSARD